MELFIHGVNGIECIKENINNYNINGIEVDFQYCDNHLINTHHFYFGCPLIRKNWLDKREYSSLEPQTKEGECHELDEIISLIDVKKKIIIDLKNWIMSLPGLIINNNYAYIHDRQMLAEIFWQIMEKHKNKNNILIQSYDHELIIMIIKMARDKNIENNFEFGFLIRNEEQAEGAIIGCQETPISFLAIRYNTLMRFGGTKEICKKIKRPINIYSWFDLDDILTSDKKRLELIKKAKCDGYIK